MTDSPDLSVPVLTTAMSGPLQALEQAIIDNQTKIEAWFRKQWQETAAPIYGSVDLRNAGFKLAPVDMNLFPAGFNNLNPDFLPISVQAAQMTLERNFPNCARVLLVAESHTRNLRYWESVHALQTILEKAGFDIRLSMLDPNLDEAITLDLPSGAQVTVHPLQRQGDRVSVEGFDPCVVLLNNDLSDGEPDILKGLEQPVRPGIELGWHRRLKSVHFHHYQQVAQSFAELIDIDPWLVDPLFQHCGQVDFMKREGEKCLARNVEKLLAEIQKKYDQYGIKQKPFVVVKADAGTYGMSVMTVRSAEEVLSLNRKQRTKMAASKGSQTVTRVIMQEGVYSFETWGEGDNVAEPVVYMLGPYVIGGFYRVHKNKGADESLNTPGMHFEPLQFVECCNTPDKKRSPNDCPNRFYAYGVIARLSQLAAAREQKEHQL